MTIAITGWEQLPARKREALLVVAALTPVRLCEIADRLERDAELVRKDLAYLASAQLVYRRSHGFYALVTNPPRFRSRYRDRYVHSPRDRSWRLIQLMPIRRARPAGRAHNG